MIQVHIGPLGTKELSEIAQGHYRWSYKGQQITPDMKCNISLNLPFQTTHDLMLIAMESCKKREEIAAMLIDEFAERWRKERLSTSRS